MEFLTNDKLVIVGAAGMIGSNMAQTALMMGLTSNLCLYDVFSPEGVAEEMRQSGFDNVNITATTNVAEAFKDAKYIISSGGAPRKQGMTREDLLKGNCEIAEQLGKDIKAYCPDVKHVVIIFNPADLTGLVTLLYSGLKPSQVTPLAALDARDYRLQAAAAAAEYKRVKAEAERVMALYADGAATPDAYDKARYGLQQITAKYENSRNQLADTEIRMPFDGYVQKRLFDPSPVVGARMPVLPVVSAEAPEIEINIPGSEYVRRSEFDGFEAAFDFRPGKRIPLRLRSISPKANANQLYTLRLGVPAVLRPLSSPGMISLVTIVCRPSGAAQVAVPAVALFDDGDRTCVWICREDSTVVSREVRVERLQPGGEAVVGAGLAAGERIVTSGVHRLREGEKVAPLPGVTKTNVGGVL